MALPKKHLVWLVGGAVLAIAVIVDIILLIFTHYLAQPLAAKPTVQIKIGQQIIAAEVVQSPLDLYRGLSYRPSLAPTGGLLFVFSDSEIRDFVMRYMKFPLDIIFINQHKIIKIAADLPPEGGPPNKLYDSGGPADLVLEVNAGYAREQGIKVGDEVTIGAKLTPE
jgi:uncharacterized membrane protein (UPF0127 family)